MIAKIFGEIPIECPRCGTIMNLKGFIFDDVLILKFFPYISRAPPKIILEDYIPQDDDIIYARDESDISDVEFDQTRQGAEDDFNQDNKDNNW